MRLILILHFIFFFSFSFCQSRKVITEKFGNNSIAAKGDVITCPGYDEKYPCYNSTCRKAGKWTYYYQNGNVKRVEYYKAMLNCNEDEIPDGLWQYFDENGILVKKEEYENGILWTADIASYYYNNELAGEIRVRNGVTDTLEYVEKDTSNLIKNGDFIYYYGPLQFQFKNGQNQIEKQIPFWMSPDANTPDYYNQYRGLKNVPDNQSHGSDSVCNYIGIILYHEPTGNYSEYITGELKSKLTPYCRYCLKIRIRLSQNSGFCINKLAVYFSDSISSVQKLSENSRGYTNVTFNKTLDQRNEWDTLYASFKASGHEKYLTLGRFSSVSETLIKGVNPVSICEGDFNKSAYYIIDKIELLRDTSNFCMDENMPSEQATDRINFDQINRGDSLALYRNKTLILKNIFFNFDKSTLLPASLNELEKFFAFLVQNNVSVIITGHTDNIGAEDYNKTLSLSRAKSVCEWLVNRGISRNRIEIAGYGSEIPIVSNDSEENRAINRRVEFKIK